MKEETDPEILKEWQENSKYWIFGIFYYDKNDNRILPPKPRTDLGSTINFAHRGPVIAFLLTMAFFIFVVSMILTHQSVTNG